ncbi:MAG TPA: endopeptidase La [Phycisphaerae bacterium]|nr:endopeptidase La [Phycisphaerae bacterium]
MSVSEDDLKYVEDGVPDSDAEQSEDTDGDAGNGDDGDLALESADDVAPDSHPLGVSALSAAMDESNSDPSKRPRIPKLLPILPIRDTVVFPGTIVPLTVGREKSKRLVAEIGKGMRVLGAVAQQRGEIEDPTLEDLYRVGTVVAVLKRLELADGSQSIIVHGLTRFGIEELVQTEPYLIGKANPRDDTYVESPRINALVETAKRLAERVIGLTPGVPEEALTILNNISKPGALADFLAANLSMGLIQKQELLETFDISARLEKINSALAGQLQILELSAKIHNQVKSQIDKSQREYYLQEQLQAIQKELGHSDGREAEIERLRELVLKAKMPENVEKEATRELERLARMNPASPEYSGVIDYLEWMCELPWAISTEDNLDIARARVILDEDHHDLDKVKKRIMEFLAVRKLNPTGKGSILCFAGPPGVGKTSLGQSIARAMGRHFIRMSVGGVRDEAELRGHRRTYIGSMPGRIIQEVRKAGSNNPVFMIDEVDKIGSDARGDPSSALLEVLDPAQNATFQDHYLGVPFDLSNFMFICTANYMEMVPPALKDRMEVIDIAGYTKIDKKWIAKKYLVPRRMRESGLSPEMLEFDDEAIKLIIDSYTAEAGVRNLEREIGAICRGVAALVAEEKDAPRVITPEQVEKFLGPPKHEEEVALRTSTPGVVTGLAWTPYGGLLLFVEATAMLGRGNLQLTGQLGDVMRESVHAALSLVRTRAKKYGIDAAKLMKQDIHVHVPAGAIPKDGPSAGIAMFTALVSLLTGRPCRSDVAMTGEVTLRGLVLPIGGLKEKALAAHHAGIKSIIISERNKKDLVEIPPEIRDQIKFVTVTNVDEVLAAALRPKGAKPEDETQSEIKTPLTDKSSPAKNSRSARKSPSKRRKSAFR